MDGTNSVTLTAAVTNDKKSAGVNWTVSGGGTLSNTTTTSTTYTAPAATSSAQTITVTATSVADSTKTGTATITVPAKPTITTTGTSLAATVGAAYSVQLTGSGGISPYTWTVASGTLPPCLSMSTGGLITGTVTAACAGTYSPVFTMTDSGTPTKLTATVTLNMTIAAAPAIAFTGTMPATATYNVAYAGSAAAGGGAGTLTYSLAGGALPAGVALNASTGAVAGTPTAAGTFNFTVKAADAYGDSNTQAYSVVVSYPAMSITTAATLPTGYVGSNYTTTTLAATGGAGLATNYTWAVTGGSLPVGLTLSTAGVISGKPSGTAGTSTFTVTVTDTVASLSSNSTFTIVVDAGVSVTTATTLPVGYAGSNYSQALAATGGSGTGYTWAVSGGSTLPAGLSLSTVGVLSGKPTAAGTSTFSITVTDSVGNTASATFSLTIDAGITINAITLPKGYEGTAYPGATFTATGGTNTGYTWSATGLPAGLSISTTTGAISGTPTAAGTFSIVATVTDSVGNTASTTVSLVVEATLSITTGTTLPGGTKSVAYSQQLAATGGSGTGYTWTTDAAGTTSLATLNLALSAGGLVSGTPATTGTATFAATATDSETHTASATFSVTVTNALTITTTTLPATNMGASYSQTLNAGGGTGTNYTWTTTSSNLSTYGLSLSSAGVVSGTPTQAGTASFTAQVTDSGSNTATQALTITIYSALTLPAPSASVPGPGTTGGVYSGSITATGGSGGYSWTVTGLPADGLSYSAVAGTLNITGTPSSATTVSFTAQVTDTATSVSASNAYSIVVSNPATLTLPAPSPQPSSLPAATVGQLYSGSISASGGASPYTWTVNSTAVPTNGTPVALTNGLSVTNNGSSTLSVGGTPTTTTPVSIAATIKDNAGTPASNTYSVTVNSAGQTVSGRIGLNNNCGGGSSNPPTITVTIANSGNTFTQTASTDSNGNYNFTGIPNDTYTITPSITGPSSVFYPVTQSVTVNNADLTNQNFNVSLGYTVSGTVSYGGSTTGQIYLNLVNNSCGGSGNGNGTSISAKGPFTIRGVAPGSYTLQAWMDPSTLAEGDPNTSDPTGSTSGVTVTAADLTGQTVTLTDPTVTVQSAGPTVKAVAPTDQGVAISFGGGSVSDSNGNEVFTSYTVEWSTSNTFSSPSSATLKAAGRDGNVWIVNNGIAGISGSFTNGTVYYFRVKGTNSAGSSNWTVWGGGTPTAITIGAPTSGSTVSGTITIPSTVTVSSGAQLYAGLFNESTNTAYAAVITSPTNSVSGNAFSVHVPDGSYILFGILDQNHDGVIDAGDVTNVRSNAVASVTVSGGNLSGKDLTLPATNSTSVVQTQYNQATDSGGSTSSYYLTLEVGQSNKLPVAVTLTAGPSVINPVDLSNYCQGCGNAQFQYNAGINSATPNVGDAYTFTVKYSDGSSENVTANVTAFGSTGAVVGASDLATNLSPTVSGTTTPTFTWSDPANASNYTYQFQIQGSGNTIWQIPGQNANSSGFDSSITSITWGTDPTGDSSNVPSVGSLTSGTYNWSITVQDSNGNQAQNWTYFVVP